MTRRIRRRTVLAASIPLLVSACLRREDGTQPGMGAGELHADSADDRIGTAAHDDGTAGDGSPPRS